MTLRPETRDELARSLRSASASGAEISNVDLAGLSRILEHTPEDMTVTVEAGLTLAALQTALRRYRQWVPIDPPHPEQLTIRDLIDRNLSGPRRYGFGTVRDHLIGLRVALADGRIVHSGGKVVKNVAGYDLLKLFVGAHGSLGVVAEATFKLSPLPESECFIQARCDSLDRAEQLLESILASEVTPVVLDLHRPSNSGAQRQIHFVLGFAGTSEEVAWQLERAGQMGISEAATLDYVAAFYAQAAPPALHASVAPSKLITTLQELGPVSFVARAGNGVIYHRGGLNPTRPALPVALIERVKAAFDPGRIFPGLPL